MRRAGYHPVDGKKEGELVFVRTLGPSEYPRFHAYVSDGTINLHLDQKRPVYKGTPAHAAEYEGEIVEKEAQRIKNIIMGL